MLEKRFFSPGERWKAVTERDPSAEGHFIYAVRTTGIFCRPTCPARRPRRPNVVFFDSPEEAQREGFRSCKRCRPLEVSSAQRIVSQVQAILQAAETPPALAQLAESLEISPFHLQRVFKKATGLSPKKYALALRDQRLRDNLKEGKPVTTAMYDAGFGSSHALYSGGRERLGMKPKAYQQGGKGERILYGNFDSELGPLFLAATGRGLISLGFGEAAALLRALRHELPAATFAEDRSALETYRQGVTRYLREGGASLDLPLDVAATEFQQQVWEALRQIPQGETRSYGQIAAMIGKPAAVRAVARACATNPVALVIPCHRVILGSGKMGGYRWGEDRKERLLEREKERSTP